MPGTAARTLACAAELLARFLKLRYEGIAIASRIPRMMMTTSSSIRVKPLSSLARRFRRVLIMRWGSFQVRFGGARLDRPGEEPAGAPKEGSGRGADRLSRACRNRLG